MTIDPELRRTLLAEIAFQRYERGRFRRTGEPARAEGCNRAIRALRNVWDAAAAVERERSRERFAADPINGTWIPAGLGETEMRWLAGDR